MKRIVVLLLFLSSIQATATHIVGGEFQMTHISADIYKFDLIIYFDMINGNPGARDYEINARIFRNSDNAGIANVNLPLVEEIDVNYLNPNCFSSNFLVSKLTYSTILSLSPEEFNDPGGYYISWERCCRNYTITNIYSEDPNTGSIRYAGQAFVLDFPPVINGGVPFINSSPKFNQPNSDYACINQQYYADLSATDADGDSLVYTITTPLNTHTGDALPIDLQPKPKPYPLVSWRPGFSEENIMNGVTDLTIGQNGLLSVIPTMQGLFVYQIKCEEYRNKIKIGEVRRDFQILVKSCPTATEPVVSAKSLDGAYSDADLDVYFNSATLASERCIKIKVEDNDIFGTVPTEQITIKAIPIGADFEVSGFLPEVASATLDQDNPFAEFQICFDRCSPLETNVFTIGIVAYDNTCPVALTDTIRVHVTLEPSEFCQAQSIVFPSIGEIAIDDNSFSLTATSSSGLPVTYTSEDETIATVSESTVTIHSAGQVRIKATQSGDDTYRKATSVVQQFCVNPKPPVLTLQQSAFVLVSDYESGSVWYKDETALFESNAKTLTAAEAGTYSARVVVKNCISAHSGSIVITKVEDPVTAVNDKLTETVKIFPNPTDHSLTVSVPGNGTKTAEIFGMSGISVIRMTGTEESQLLDIHHLPPGMYIVKIRRGDELYVRKIIKK
jgi:hypothetical protein